MSGVEKGGKDIALSLHFSFSGTPLQRERDGVFGSYRHLQRRIRLRTAVATSLSSARRTGFWGDTPNRARQQLTSGAGRTGLAHHVPIRASTSEALRAGHLRQPKSARTPALSLRGSGVGPRRIAWSTFRC